MNDTSKPILFNAAEAHASQAIRYEEDGTAILVRNGETIRIPRANQFDLTQGTVFGLNERLTGAATSPAITADGKTLRDLFNDEWQAYEAALDSYEETGRFEYGVYAYYPARGDLVRYCPPFWHRVVAVASSSMLLADPACEKRWREIREILSQTTLAVAGASVGNNIIHACVMDMRPDHIKIADKSRYKMENINRVRLGYRDIVESDQDRTDPTQSLLRNKAVVTADQLYAIDPFLTVHVYDEGIADDNLERFFSGGEGEPAADMIVEEVDDPRIKIQLREEARRRRIPLVMATDIGSSVQIDVMRYDQDASLPMAWGSTDEALIESMEEVYRHPGNRAVFFSFVDRLIGSEYRTDELARIINATVEIPTSTIIPQLGSTAMAAGGALAEIIARIRLGHDVPRRAMFNKKTFEVRHYDSAIG